mmetsp:Transcript_9122/g.21907  ORF Transcript_9122/g.21907 Transcript_9122/m.21907 type:complete len:204 (-) Transcript_9122:931-1542(-)
MPHLLYHSSREKASATCPDKSSKRASKASDCPRNERSRSSSCRISSCAAGRGKGTSFSLSSGVCFNIFIALSTPSTNITRDCWSMALANGNSRSAIASVTLCLSLPLRVLYSNVTLRAPPSASWTEGRTRMCFGWPNCKFESSTWSPLPAGFTARPPGTALGVSETPSDGLNISTGFAPMVTSKFVTALTKTVPTKPASGMNA